MPVRDETNDLDYLTTPLTVNSDPAPATKDADEYTTLKSVFSTLQQATISLYGDFNAFSIAKEDMPEERAKKLLHDIEVRQGIFDVLAPLVQQVGDAISKVDDDFKRRQKQ